MFPQHRLRFDLHSVTSPAKRNKGLILLWLGAEAEHVAVGVVYFHLQGPRIVLGRMANPGARRFVFLIERLDIFDSDWREQLPPSSQVGHVQTILHTLESVRPQQKTSIGPLLQQLAEKARRRGLVFLISDCLDSVDGILTGLRHLRFQGHEVTVFHVLHNDELELPFTGMTRFDGLEMPRQLLTRPHLIRPAYLRALKEYLTKLRLGCETQRCDYVLVDTTKPLGAALQQYLAARLLVRRI